MRIVITGGGTGGHLYPALAVAEGLKAHAEVSDILYIGNRNRSEATLVPQYGIRFEGLSFSGMPRGFHWSIFPWGMQLWGAFWQARNLLKHFKPNVVFATGGYITAPVILAALTLQIPIVLHEPDAYPGLVNRQFAPYAATVTCAFAGARERLRTKQLQVTGNPLRSQIGHLYKAKALKNLQLPWSLEKPILLVIGGSQGARKLNQSVVEALPDLIDFLGLQVFHQTGEALFEETVQACPTNYRDNPAYQVHPFITDIASVLALADIAVCRSGSMTLSEMYQAAVPTILVPYPFAAADHQRKNALASQEAGASLVIEDADFNASVLSQNLQTLFSQPRRLKKMKTATQALAMPEATDKVIALILKAAQASSA